MTEERDPTRWTAAGSEIPHELREMVSASRARLGSADEVARLSEALSRTLGPSAGLLTAAPKAGKSLAWLYALWGGAGLIAALALSWPAPEPAKVTPPVAQPPKVTAAPPPAPEPHAETETQPELEPATPKESVKAEPSAAAPAAKTKPPARARTERRDALGDGASEAALLEKARAALAARPSEALALTREHSRRFRSGMLAEEREVIAIEALERLGRKAEAERRAREFERRYRGSVHSGKLQGESPR